jgi:hypothetical protein
VVRGDGHVADECRRSREQRHVVDVSLVVGQLTELGREADREQEAEEDLRAGDQRAELVQQLLVLALEALLQVLVGLLPLDEPLGQLRIGHRPILSDPAGGGRPSRFAG